MKFSKIFSLLLVLCMLCAIGLTACGDSETENSSTNSDASAVVNPYQDANGKYVGSYSGKNYEGETITFLTCSVNPTYESEILYNTYEDGTKQTIPEALNESLKLRAENVEEILGITIEELKVHDTGGRPGGGMYNYIVQGNLSATTEYQIVVPCIYDGAKLAADGQFRNLLGADFEGLQIEAPWWNQDFNASMTIGNQLYFTIGDIGYGNKSATAALFFNLDLWNKNSLNDQFGANPYDLVRSGDWTVDVVFEATSLIGGQDTTGDNKIDYEDVFGWGGQLDDMWSIFYASGERIAQPDKDGYPALSMFNERSAKLMEKLQEFVQDKEHYISANDYFNVVQWPSELVEKGFTDGRALFYNAGVGSVINLGSAMEQHFGMVPVPKADKGQDNYYSLVNPWSSTCFAVPSCVPDSQLTMVIDVLNVMGAESLNTVAPNYQEILEYMKIRDDDSAEMLNDYIVPSRGCDVGLVYRWGDLGTLLHNMASANVGTFASQYDSVSGKAQNDLEETLGFYKDNE